MELLPGDIIIKNTKAGEGVWLSQRLLTVYAGVTEEYLRVRARKLFKRSIPHNYNYGSFLPDTGASWRWARYKDRFYYEIDSIPDRKPAYYRSKLGTKAEIIALYEDFLKRQKEKKELQVSDAILKGVHLLVQDADIRYYTYEAPVGFTLRQAREMATARAWCRYISQMLTDDKYKRLGIMQVSKFYALCSEIIAPMELEGFKVTSAEYLRHKVNDFPYGKKLQEQLDFFISGKYGNDNAAIVGKYPIVDEDTGEVFNFDIHQALMFNLYMNPGRPQKEVVRSLYLRYVEYIQDFEVQAVAYETFVHHVRRFNKDIVMAHARHGEEYYKKHFLSYVPTKKLQYAHSLFAGDGSGTISYKYYKRGVLKHRKLYVMIITDIASRKIVGYSFAPEGKSSESPVMTQEAVKMAIDTCDRQTMFEFVSDNHGAFTEGAVKDFLSLVFNKVRNIERKNSQANPAETQFRLFKSSLKDRENFLSSSWDAGVEGRNNPDFIQLETLPTYEQAKLQFAQLADRWNDMPLADGVSPNERFEHRHPDCEQMDAKVLRYIFGNHTQVDLSYMRGFVNVYKTQGYQTIESRKYEIPDYGGTGTELISKALGYTRKAKVKVVWDEEMADLYTPEGKFILSCPPAIEASQSHAESTEENIEALGYYRHRKLSQLEYAKEFEREASEALKAITGDSEEDIEELPYEHAMALGSNKSRYNEAQTGKEEEILKHPTKRTIALSEFDPSDWEDINDVV